jgi:hypothetical protein
MIMNNLRHKTTENYPLLYRLGSPGLILILFSLIPYISFGQQPERTVLLEEFTGEWCGWCPIGMMEMEEMIERYGDTLIALSVHSSDLLETPSASGMIGAWASAFPSGVINRTYDSILNTQTFFPGEWETVIAGEIATPSPCLVQLAYSYNEPSRLITADVTALFTADFIGDTRPNLYIVEDSVTGVAQHNYLSGNPDFINTPYYSLPDPIPGFVHRHVLREMVGESYGVDGIIPDTVLAGQSFTYTFTYAIPDGYNTGRLSLIAVVHKHKGLKKYRRILNARQENFSPLGTGITPLENKEAVRVWPNPAHDVITIRMEGPQRIKTVQLFSLTGIKLAEYRTDQPDITLPVEEWKGSCILLRTETNLNETSHRLVIVQ